MDAHLVKRWNNVVGPNDRVYFLGDFTLCSLKTVKILLKRLNYGAMIWVKGNHDKSVAAINTLPRVFGVGRLTIRVPNLGDALLTHRPDDYIPSECFVNFHGHTHGRRGSEALRQEKDTGRKWFNVGVDVHGLRPLHMNEVVSYINRNK
jgi:calcineurin-like phosphoesterase family protein